MHRGSTVDCSISGSSMNRNTNVGPVHGFGSPTTLKHSNEGSRGGKRLLDATGIRPLYTDLLSRVLLELQYPLHLVERMLMKTSTIPRVNM
jgi:hypothetical protein